MKVVWLGEQYGPDSIQQFGIVFERKGAPVTVPDNHPQAQKFIGNRFFRCTDLPKGIVDYTGEGVTLEHEEEIPQPPSVPADGNG